MRIGSHARIADPAKSRDWKAYVRLVASQHAPTTPLAGPVRVRIVCVFPRPRARKREHWHTVKPDVDNLVKLVLDSLNGIVYQDDKQVARLELIKVYGDTGITIVKVEALEET